MSSPDTTNPGSDVSSYRIELLSPAGNLEKLRYAYLYGADAAYIGIKGFSLRAKADNFHDEEWAEISRIKGSRKLYCALNLIFHNRDLAMLESELDYIAQYPFDAFIISDLGALPILKRKFPDTPLHLSTQANCVNREAAKVYHDLGFSRVILGRETSLSEIREIRDAVPDLQLEAFVHGAMCLAYSGRCFLSAYMTGRSGNQGACTHSCRWEYRMLEEKERPGEYYPVVEGDGFTTLLSSKDLCMIDHLEELSDAGIDSLKIEGRMKSLYYAAVVTRAYRKHIDALTDGRNPLPKEELNLYRDDLFKVSRREYSTGFYFNKNDIEKPNLSSYARDYLFLGTVGPAAADGFFEIDVKNRIPASGTIEFIGPDVPFISDKEYILHDENNQPAEYAGHGKPCLMKPSVPVKPGFIIRMAQSVDNRT